MSSRVDNSASGVKMAVEGRKLPEGGRGAPMVMEALDGYGDSWRGGRRLEMLTFNGENPDGWIFRAELFFEMNQLSKTEKIMVARVSFEEKALAWYCWVDARTSGSFWFYSGGQVM